MCQRCLGGCWGRVGVCWDAGFQLENGGKLHCACRSWQETMQARYGYDAYALNQVRLLIPPDLLSARCLCWDTRKVDGRDNPPSRVARHPTHRPPEYLSTPSTCKLNTTTTSPNRQSIRQILNLRLTCVLQEPAAATSPGRPHYTRRPAHCTPPVPSYAALSLNQSYCACAAQSKAPLPIISV